MTICMTRHDNQTLSQTIELNYNFEWKVICNRTSALRDRDMKSRRMQLTETIILLQNLFYYQILTSQICISVLSMPFKKKYI